MRLKKKRMSDQIPLIRFLAAATTGFSYNFSAKSQTRLKRMIEDSSSERFKKSYIHTQTKYKEGLKDEWNKSSRKEIRVSLIRN
jgi:hypothetical protein